MSKARTITVTLTERQYAALAGAVSLVEAEAEGDPLVDVRRLQVLERAWRKLSTAWWAGTRR